MTCINYRIYNQMPADSEGRRVLLMGMEQLVCSPGNNYAYPPPDSICGRGQYVSSYHATPVGNPNGSGIVICSPRPVNKLFSR